MVSMVETLTASVNPFPPWPGHLDGTKGLWWGRDGCELLWVLIWCHWQLGGSLPGHLCPKCRFTPGCSGELLVTEPSDTEHCWPRCNRMRQHHSRWTCHLLSVLTPLWVPSHPLGPGGAQPVPLCCVCSEQVGWEVTVYLQSPLDKQGRFHAVVPPWQTPCF